MSHHNHHDYRKVDKTIWWIMAGFVVLIVALVGITQGNRGAIGSALSGSSQLTSDKRSFDFGTISMADGKVQTNFTVTNASEDPVTVSKVYTSCMCTSAKLALGDREFGPYGMPGHGAIPTINQEIPAGSSGIIEVTYDPAAHGPAGVGFISRNVIVETTGGKKLTLTINAKVTP